RPSKAILAGGTRCPSRGGAKLPISGDGADPSPDLKFQLSERPQPHPEIGPSPVSGLSPAGSDRHRHNCCGFPEGTFTRGRPTTRSGRPRVCNVAGARKAGRLRRAIPRPRRPSSGGETEILRSPSAPDPRFPEPKSPDGPERAEVRGEPRT